MNKKAPDLALSMKRQTVMWFYVVAVLGSVMVAAHAAHPEGDCANVNVTYCFKIHSYA
jgi:hypothetical protein